MTKIFLGGPGACGVHNEKNTLEDFLIVTTGITLINNYEEADIIIILDTCIGTPTHLERNINYLEKVLLTKKETAKVILSGCITKGLTYKLPQNYLEILNKVQQVPTSKIIEYIIKLLNVTIDKKLEELITRPALTWLLGGIQIAPVEGCLNNCSFCKTNYMDFNLKSTPFENLKWCAEKINESTVQDDTVGYINIHASNLSLYGVDLYGKQRAHDAIRILSSPDSIKVVMAGALINWYKELLTEILNNPKIKSIFISLESGSERVYNLMNRPISLNKLIEIIKTIRKERPDIIIDTEFICGFPTETKDDLNKTIDTIQRLNLNPIAIHPYQNSAQVPSSHLPQHSFEYCKELAAYSKEQLKSYLLMWRQKINNGELLVLDKIESTQKYMVLLLDGSIKFIPFNSLDKEYNVNDLIPKTTKSRILLKK